MTKKELVKILSLHKKWLNNELEGCRANLSGVNLSGANLIGANLSWANLSGVNLSEANLSWANLSGANLSGANLIGTDLSNILGYKETKIKVTIAEKAKQMYERQPFIKNCE